MGPREGGTVIRGDRLAIGEGPAGEALPRVAIEIQRIPLSGDRLATREGRMATIGGAITIRIPPSPRRACGSAWAECPCRDCGGRRGPRLSAPAAPGAESRG